MSQILHLDPFGGVAGDMLLGALIDLGAGVDEVRAMLEGLGLGGWRLIAERDRQQGFAGTRARVEVERESQPARRLADVERLLSEATLPERVRVRALAAFRTLFEAESAVHGIPLHETHLHELAAVDAVIDIVGACAAVELLGCDRVTCGPVPLGSGVVRTAHGVLPVPPPAVTRLMIGVPLAAHVADGEMTTPTGATLLRTLVDGFGPHPAGTIVAVGVGLGTRHFAGVPNLLRAFLVSPAQPHLAARQMAVVETTLDDVTGESLGWLAERAREAGAVDAWCLAGTGRKGRPIAELRALVEPARVNDVLAVLFSEGGTLGARVIACDRPELARTSLEVDTPYGVVPVKVGTFRGRVVSVKPEHDACAARARESGASFAAVADAARRAAPLIGSTWEEPV
jgi:pyridinium-3,5-bisthiocarboxylic acid mononucleotide nickel chelatase